VRAHLRVDGWSDKGSLGEFRYGVGGTVGVSYARARLEIGSIWWRPDWPGDDAAVGATLREYDVRGCAGVWVGGRWSARSRATASPIGAGAAAAGALDLPTASTSRSRPGRGDCRLDGCCSRGRRHRVAAACAPGPARRAIVP
jgi:hypothetical protein